MAITMMTLCARLNYASRLRWSCAGKIVAVTQDRGSHNAPMLFVEADGRTESFSMVDVPCWKQARAGMSLKKAAGSPNAWMDGRLVRMRRSHRDTSLCDQRNSQSN